MCEACDEFPPLFIAYFNKPGGKLWRPSRAGGATPIVHSSQSASAPVRAFVCDAASPAPATGEGGAVVSLSPTNSDAYDKASLLPLPVCGERVGVRGTFHKLRLTEGTTHLPPPDHPPQAGEGQGEGDLSPQAGRGEAAARRGAAAECGRPAPAATECGGPGVASAAAAE